MGIPSAYYSLEMGAKQVDRPYHGTWHDVEFKSYACTIRWTMASWRGLTKRRISCSSYPSITMISQRPVSRATDYSNTGNGTQSTISVLRFIDYLQILANGSGDNREQLIGDMARDLKRLAVELNICVVAISQLSRAKDKPEPNAWWRCVAADRLRKHATPAVLVYRPFVYGIERYKDSTLTYGTAQLPLPKVVISDWHRIVAFNGDLTYFYDRTDQSVTYSNSQADGMIGARYHSKSVWYTYYNTADWDIIRKIQAKFNLPRCVTVNGETCQPLRGVREDMELLRETEKRGIYR